MGGFTAVHLEEIEEITDGRCPWRPVRHHLGIKSFGINAWTAREAGDRLINEHDEADTEDQQEELYFVQDGRARFELDGESVDAPAGTFVHVQPGVKRTAFAEEPADDGARHGRDARKAVRGRRLGGLGADQSAL